jgi:hypothetical protein
MKKTTIFLAVLLSSISATAGVVYEIEVKDHDQSPPKKESIDAMVEGRNLKMGIASGGRDGSTEMIYRGDRREMVFVDHDKRTYTVIDEKTMKELAAQISDAMAMMEQALANVPESQRPMIEEMMKKKMPQVQTVERPKTELRKTGERAEHSGYPCVRYEVLRDGRAIRELWVTDWSNVEGGADVADAFYGMSEFFKEMLDSLPKFADSGGADQAFEHMREMNGFPVVTRELDDDGSLDNESTLKSARRQTLDPDAFEPPSGYKRQEMFRGK